MSKSEVPTKFFWLDLETTGLDPQKDRIVEVAALVSDVALNEIDNYHSLVKHDEAEITELLLGNPFWVERPAEMKQIIAEMRTGKSESAVEEGLITLAERHFSPDEPIFLAGNTVYFDKNFVQAWLPNFHAKLRYRILDVSSFKLWWLAHGKPEYAKRTKHRALDDIRESIAELKAYSQDISF